jgi:Zn-dependent protease/predicted transcriptional regulator
MKWTLKLGRFLGVDVYLHGTFLLLLGFLAVAHWLPQRSLSDAASGVLFFVSLFGCVLLHEFGHALAARRYGIVTQDITLLPIGGLARLERIPDRPIQEFWISLAGPAVNVVIATALAVGLLLTNSFEPLGSLSTTRGSFAERLMAVNLFLILFNLLPAFPMDGGRVLRSVLAMRMDYVRATHIAARLGQGMAFLFAFFGLFGNPMLLFIAFFVWMGASNELGAAQTRSALAGITVAQVLMTEFDVLKPTDTLGTAVRHVLAGSQQDFPVVDDDGVVVGLLERRQLVDGLSRLGSGGLVHEAMLRSFPSVSGSDLVESIVSQAQLQEFGVLPVKQDGRLIGLLTLENLSEFLLIQSALRGSLSGQSPGKAIRHQRTVRVESSPSLLP